MFSVLTCPGSHEQCWEACETRQCFLREDPHYCLNLSTSRSPAGLLLWKTMCIKLVLSGRKHHLLKFYRKLWTGNGILLWNMFSQSIMHTKQKKYHYSGRFGNFLCASLCTFYKFLIVSPLQCNRKKKMMAQTIIILQIQKHLVFQSCTTLCFTSSDNKTLMNVWSFESNTITYFFS